MINSGSKGFLGGTADVANPYSGGGAQNNARALGSLGRALSQMGGAGLDIMHDLQAAENSKTENDVINFWNTKFGEHEAETMKITDPKKRNDKMESLLGSLKAEGFEGRMISPITRERLEVQWGRTATKYRNRGLSQSAQLLVDQTRASLGLRVDQHYDNGERGEALTALKDNYEAAGMSLPEYETAVYRLNKRFDSKDKADLDIDLRMEIDSEPRKVKEMFDAGVGPFQDMDDDDKLHYKPMIERGVKIKDSRDIQDVRGFMENTEGLTASILKEHLDVSYPDMQEKRKANLIKGFKRGGELEATEEEQRELNLKIDRLGRDLEEKKLTRGDGEHYKRWKAIDSELDSLPPSGRRGAWLHRMRGLDPFASPADSNGLLPAKVGADFLSTGKNQLINLLERDRFGKYYVSPEDTKSTGKAWMSGQEHLDNRLDSNSRAEKLMDKERRKFIGWFERNKNSMSEEKYDEYFNKLQYRLITETE